MKFKILLTFLIILVSIFVYGQAPAYVGSAKFPANGLGTDGVPTVNFLIPTGVTNKNRLLVITMASERHHVPNASNFLVGSISATLPDMQVNGVNATKHNGYHRESTGGTSTINFQLWGAAVYSYALPSGLTGTVPITFTNLNLPESINDEMSIIVSVYENVKSLEFILTSFPVGTASSAPAVTPALGRTASEIMYLVNGGITQQTDLSLSSGWALDQANKIDNIQTAATGIAANEHDGLAHILGHRNGFAGNPSVTVSRTGTGGVYGGIFAFHALMPFAKPAVSGTVYRDNNGLTGDINNGGTGGGVWNTASTLWVNAVIDGIVVATASVNASGIFSFPAGGNLTEGDVVTFQLSKNQGVAGGVAPAVELSSNWLTVGESTTSGPSDGTPDGEFVLTIGNANSPNNTTNRFGVVACAAGTVVPALNATAQYSNINFAYTIPCGGGTTANLSTLTASNTPAGTSITWHTASPATDANKVSPVTVTAIMGTTKLYAAFFDAALSCYSPTREVTVSAPICATDDDYSATPIIAGIGGTLPSIFGNDTYSGNTISLLPPNSVDFLYELWVPANAIVDVAGNGSLTIPGSVLPGTYTYLYKICDNDPDVAEGSSCSTATVTFIVDIDSDGDGVVDSVDLDDDNDGILDIHECEVINTVTNGTFTTNINGWSADPGGWYGTGTTARNETNGVSNSVLSQTVSNLNSLPSTMLAISMRVGAQDFNNVAGSTATLDIMLGGTVYATITNSTLRNTSNVTISLASGVTSNFVTFGTNGSTGAVFSTPFTIQFPYSGSPSATLAFRMNGGSDDFAIDDISILVMNCEDLDGDGTPNHLDLDADGDDCFDAIEGDETAGDAQLNPNGSINSAVDTDGVPVLVNSGGVADAGGDQGQGIGQSQNGLDYSACCPVSVSGWLDSDGDGIADKCDLDDDNDGILDTEECVLTNLVTNGTFDTNFTSTWTNDGGWTYNATGKYVENTSFLGGSFGNFTQLISNLPPATIPLAFTLGAKDGSTNSTGVLQIFLGGTLYATVNNSTGTTNNITLTLSNGATSNFTPFTATSTVTYVSQTFTIDIPYTGPTSSALNFKMGTSQTDDWYIDNVSINTCDTDADGIPNNLDLDSDNDDCTDAIEGGGNYTTSQLTNASGTISSQIPNLNFGTDVDANGVPTIVGAAGQTVGQALDATKNDCLDSDNDGYPNWMDFDDDNDGILDTVECPTVIIINNGTFASPVTEWTLGTGWDVSTGIARNENDNTNSNLSQVLNNLDATNGLVKLSFTLGAQDGFNTAGYSASLNIILNGTTYATFTNGSVRTIGTNNVTQTLFSGATSTFTPFSTASTPGFTTQNVVITIPYTGPNSATLTFNHSAGVDDWSVDNVLIDTSECDLDGDGIPNNLDLDADNDGCVDAYEGDENVTLAQLVTAGGTVEAGFGSTADNLNLCADGTCVDAQGVPTIVNDGGSADTCDDLGQGAGSAYDASSNICVCTNSGNFSQAGEQSMTGISDLQGFTNGWPYNVPNGFIVMQSRNSGFVITRVNEATDIAEPIEGMLIYDITAQCVKLYNGTAWNCIGQSCNYTFIPPTCP